MFRERGEVCEPVPPDQGGTDGEGICRAMFWWPLRTGVRHRLRQQGSGSVKTAIGRARRARETGGAGSAAAGSAEGPEARRARRVSVVACRGERRSHAGRDAGAAADGEGPRDRADGAVALLQSAQTVIQKAPIASEQDRPDVNEARKVWFEAQPELAPGDIGVSDNLHGQPAKPQGTGRTNGA